MKLYKLTDEKGQTKNNTQWGPNVTHRVSGKGELCSAGWLHAYQHPLIAAIMNPHHAAFKNPRLWLAEGEPGKFDGHLKLGCAVLTTISELKLPKLTVEFKVRFAIKCALRVYRAPAFVKWATDWLTGKDRTRKSAAAAAAAASAAAAAAAAAYAAYAAAYAAYASAAAAAAADAAAAYDAAYAVYADAAYAAAAAASAAAAYDAAPFILEVALEVAAELSVKWES